MNAHQLGLFAHVLAEQARIEGMKAENMHRMNIGESIAYGEDAFNASADEIDRLAREIIQQG